MSSTSSQYEPTLACMHVYVLHVMRSALNPNMPVPVKAAISGCSSICSRMP